MSKKVKIFAIVILVIAVIVFIGSKVGKSPSAPASNSSLSSTTDALPITPAQPQAASGDNEFSNLLSTVTSISIDTSVLSTPAYKALRDNPVALGSDIIGRTNPFAPIGNDSSAGSVNPTVQTLQPGKVTSTTAEFSAQVSFATTAPVTVLFQYGPTDQFGFSTSPIVLSKSGVTVVTVKNLLPNTAYRVQAVAVVGSTTTNGNTMSFNTLTSPTH